MEGKTTTQLEELLVQKKEYRLKQYVHMEKSGTGLLPPILCLCLDILQSFPQLRVYTTGRSMNWLNLNEIVPTSAWHDLQVQCSICQKWPPDFIPCKEKHGISQKEINNYVPTDSKTAFAVHCCLDCANQACELNAKMYRCSICNLVTVRTELEICLRPPEGFCEHTAQPHQFQLLNKEFTVGKN